jgi:hypothetical protein
MTRSWSSRASRGLARPAIVVAALLAVASPGCDDGPEPPDCSNAAPACEGEGDRQCAGTGVEECRPNADGCLVWQEAMACGEHQACEGDGDCVCADQCEAVGAITCDGERVVSCERDGAGCLGLELRADCAADGQRCVESAAGAECRGCPADRCDAEGDQRCLDEVVQVCAVRDDGCLDWIDDRDCAALEPARVCSEDGTQATCVEGCADECGEAGATRCADAEIETCELGDGGCLAWSPTTDCAEAADYCEFTGGVAVCETCAAGCPMVGASRCVGSVAEDCAADAHGCPTWQARTDCSTLAPALECVVTGGTATCVERSGVGSCADPIVVDVPHYALAGVDFTADFTDDQLLSGAGCQNRPGTRDAVFSVHLEAGQTLRVRETSDLDAVLSLQLGCGDAEACVFSEDTGEATGYDYTATAAGTVYVVVETWDAIPRILEYEVRLDIVEPEACGNGVDDDADGAADCDDLDCFGEPGCDAAELNCADGGDNDGDGAVDCADADCAPTPACGDYQGVYELFDGFDVLDLQGHAATLTPDAVAPNGYAWAVEEITGFLVTPGTGTASTVVTLEDDDVEFYDLALVPAVALYGELYSDLYVGSNGLVTFGDFDLDPFPLIDDFFALPMVAALWTDLAPQLESTTGAPIVTIDELADAVVVTYQRTPVWYPAEGGFIEGPNDLQILLGADGTVRIAWVTVNAYDGITGVSNGIGVGALPREIDFVP